MGAIDIKSAGKIYPNGTRALEDVNITINDGEFVVLVYSDSSLGEGFDLNENFCRPFLDYLSPTEASKLIAKITSFSKQEVYKFLLEISK